jgi:putative flippase GtrA
MALAYALGIVVNFALQRALTFRQGRSEKSCGMFIGFAAVAVIGGAVTVSAALVFRYLLGFAALLGGGAATAAFFAGTVAASLVTYWMNARFVFASSGHSGQSDA